MKVSSPVIGNSDLTQDKLYLNVSFSHASRPIISNNANVHCRAATVKL